MTLRSGEQLSEGPQGVDIGEVEKVIEIEPIPQEVPKPVPVPEKEKEVVPA